MKAQQNHTISEGVAVRSGLVAGENCYVAKDVASIMKCRDGYGERAKAGRDNALNNEEYQRCMNDC